MKKTIAIYTGPLIGGVLLTLLGGLGFPDQQSIGRDILSGLAILWGLFMLYNSIQVTTEV